MRLRLIRNATLRLDYAGRALLVDPSLDPAHAWDPIPGILDPGRNPVAELPEPAEQVVAGVEGVLVSHLHIDHWDATAQRLLSRELPVACQPAQRELLAQAGFTQVHVCALDAPEQWLGIKLTGTTGHHSNGASRELLAPVSGFLLRADGEPSLWIVGDSVWCPELAEQLARIQPDVIVVNAGAARQLDGERITMDEQDVERVLEAAPDARVVAVHIEAIGHCTLDRAQLREALASYGERLLVPADGETLTL